MSANTEAVSTWAASDKLYRYGQLALLVIAAGSIYAVAYLRQVYQDTMMGTLALDEVQLGYLYSILGTSFLVCYLPSGWLADRISPRYLISFSLLGTGALGMWYATLPSFQVLLLIYGGFGVTTGLTFWAPLIKRVKIIAGKKDQGRFFGLLDGGRGLIEAPLATVALAIFMHWKVQQQASDAEAFSAVIHMYAYLCIALGVVFALIRDPRRDAESDTAQHGKANLWADLKLLAGIRELWLVAAIVFCGYHFFWSTYSFSAYLGEGGVGMSVATAALITTVKLWMRPVGGIGGGWLGDRFSNLRVLTIAMCLAAISMFCLIALPTFATGGVLAGLVIFIGTMVYAIRGLYWAILDACPIPARVEGLAIGVISVLGYLPDTFIPLINGWATHAYPGLLGYQIYYSYIAAVGVLGVIAALALSKRIAKRKAA
jgi:MFS family permease